MNHIERLIISRFLRFRAELLRKKCGNCKDLIELADLEQIGSTLITTAKEVESQKEGKPAFAKEHFEEFEEIKSALSAKRLLDEKKKQDPLDSFRDIFG